MATRAENKNIQGEIVIRYAKFCNHLFMAYQAVGQAKIFAAKTSRVNSLDNKRTIPGTEAPWTFLTPISFLRCSAAKEAKQRGQVIYLPFTAGFLYFVLGTVQLPGIHPRNVFTGLSPSSGPELCKIRSYRYNSFPFSRLESKRLMV